MDDDLRYYIRSASGLTHGPFEDGSELGSYYRSADWLDGEHPLIAVCIRGDGALDDAWILELDTEYGVDDCKLLRNLVDECIDDYYERWKERTEQGGGAR